MITAVIVDDTLAARNSLKADLEDYCPDVKLLGEAENVESGIQLINKLNPQLVFLDVEMPDGTGFDLLDKLKKIRPVLDFHLIFSTAYDKYALQAIKFSAIDFLLKPVVSDELIAAIEKVKENNSRKVADVSLSTLLSHIGKQEKGPKRIVLSTSDDVFVYRTDEIIRCESDRNYTKFFFTVEKPLLVSKTLKEYDEMLAESGFERVHNSHLVNTAHIKKFVKTDGGYLVMKDGSNVPVAQRKRDRIMDILSSI